MKALRKENLLVDERGKTVGVVLDLQHYRDMLEDLHDLQKIARRKTNSKVSYSELLERLNKRG